MIAETTTLRLLVRLLPALLLLSTITLESLLVSGCGIDFGGNDEADEPLAALSVSGSMKAGEEQVLTLAYSQTYPVFVEVECRLKQGSNIVQVIGVESVPANPQGEPDTTPLKGELDFPFEVDIPGQYKLECLTPLDEENKLSEVITITP